MKLTIKNRLPTLLRERDIRSAAAFGRALKAEQGYTLSSSQLTRYVRENPPAFDLEFVNAACNVLQCLPNDLYQIEAVLGPDEQLNPVLAFPVNAIILRKSADGSEPEPNQMPDKNTRADKNAPSEKARRKAQTPISTGPSATVFPFKKKD